MAHKKPSGRLSTAKKKAEAYTYYGYNNLDEKPEKDNSDDDDRHTKTTSSKAKAAASTHKSEPKVTSDVDANEVPDPVPDTGLTTNIMPSGNFDVHTGLLPSMPSTMSASAPTVTPGFSPLPPFVSLDATPTLSSSSDTLAVPSSSQEASSGSTNLHQNIAASQTPRHLSAVIVVLITIGVACALLGTFIVAWSCNKPRKRVCPTPSLPILQDAFADRCGDEESLFGGKERLSRPGSTGLYAWTQYSHPSINKSEVTLCGNHSNADVSNAEKSFPPLKSVSPGLKEKPAASPANNHTVARVAIRPTPPAQQTSNVMTRAANRVSAMSMSMYPGSPQSTNCSGGIGLAVGGMSPLTADGMPMLQRSVSKASTRRLSKRRSVRYSIQENPEDQGTANKGEVYEGLRITSPAIMSPAPLHKKSSSVQGRARVKTPYAPGALLRASTTLGALSGTQTNPFDDSQYILPLLSPALKTDALRERDTRALTSAMGLASPVPPSPGPTLYPDDSITLAGDRRKTPTTTQQRPQSQVLSPGMEACARLGNLMLAEFSSMASLPSTRTVAGSGDAVPALSRNKSTKKRTDDKPPRVPSPPPMPSLAQMALQHANAQEYADYRSPTYSIYGLYEADRKSRAPSEGGY
ncbi:hypothetical protein WOLCODRAFT_142345 [Wolfiporia cocos MD-104 SS10]|uniref:Transmembrane protein n=1 Tax=Wolfiporia cocos (strain MD-104) TaxID=742152 RepID=A0A2H3JGU1_WOLCO|nr:hypothetical protein WOLCODRAFT_142345 [Wolfiporia cocos MD-104 SS10]